EACSVMWYPWWVLHFAARKVARVCPHAARQRGCIKHPLMDHRDMSQRYGNLFSTSRGHSQSPLPASSYSNEQQRQRRNQDAEIPPGSVVDLDSSQKGISRKRGNDSKSWNGNQGCFYCGEVGHIVRHCVAEQAALAEEHPPLALLEDRPSRKRRNRI
ncbi:LOW QUALITY PROTEIN: hypothetical protein HID58_048423, partial [Brassica napus]